MNVNCIVTMGLVPEIKKKNILYNLDLDVQLVCHTFHITQDLWIVQIIAFVEFVRLTFS